MPKWPDQVHAEDVISPVPNPVSSSSLSLPLPSVYSPGALWYAAVDVGIAALTVYVCFHLKKWETKKFVLGKSQILLNTFFYIYEYIAC